MSARSPDTSNPARAGGVHRFGRLQLLRLLGKSERTMAWRVAEAGGKRECLLVLPRVQPPDAAALARWQRAMRQASRLKHPRLAAPIEFGVQDGWPYAVYDPRDASTLADRLPAKGLPGIDAANWLTQALQGLAFAHEAGVAHHDVQPYLLLVDSAGQLCVAGLAVAAEIASHDDALRDLDDVDAGALRARRDAAERDVLACALLLHLLLTGVPALDDADIGRAAARMSPHAGPQVREIVRLPWTVAHPVAEPLRAIVNRGTDRQQRQRYRNARTLLHALEGWLRTEAGSGGPLALLADRLRGAGVLPSTPGAAARAARLALMERERTNELAEVVLQDLALSFELLRLVNTAQVRGAQISGSGPVLTVRRAIAMLGLDGVRRAALALRDWPGPLGEAGAGELMQLMQRCKRAGRVALALRPPGYDAEVAYLVTLLQNLGRLVVHYHYPDDAQQIRRLMQPAPALRDGDPEEPGMAEESAAYAVLGTDIEAIGGAVARQWGLDDAVLAMIRRHGRGTAPRIPENDDEMLRSIASCANEAVDATLLPAPRVGAALQRVAQRYGRALSIGVRELHAALQPGATGPIAQPAGSAAPVAADGAVP